MKKLYLVTNKINGKKYVGFTSNPKVEYRFSAHVCKAMNGSNSYFHNAIRKHGKENFKVEEIYRGDDALEKEDSYIQKYNAEYNLAKGGSANQLGRTWKNTPEFAEAISKRMKGKKKNYDVWNKGKKGVQVAWNKGKKGVSEETREKMRQSARNRKRKVAV